MKSRFLALIIFLLPIALNAQLDYNHALGLRMGASDGFGAEISYQFNYKRDKRVEIDFGWRSADSYDAFRVVGLHQWAWSLFEDIIWYTGGGAGYGSYDFDDRNDSNVPFVAGVIGIEYFLNLPIMISADFRPQLNMEQVDNSSLDFDFGVSIRYLF